jgi:alpha-glucosidase
MLAFTRMLGGPMDFTPGIFNLTFNGPDSPNRVQTTLAKQLALYVVIYSPIQMAADLPGHYAMNPEAFQFIRDVPTDWEHSIALQGEIGDFVVTARQERGGADWYLGAVTDEEARVLDVPLDFLEAGRSYRAEIYRDGEDAHWHDNPYPVTVETRAVTSGDVLHLALAAGGGVAVRFVAGEAE